MPKLSHIVLLFSTVVLILGMPTPGIAAPVAVANLGPVVIVLTDEPCKLDAVSNLPYRATWTEKGKTHEGCAGASEGMIIAYWSNDKTITPMPAQIFSRATGA